MTTTEKAVNFAASMIRKGQYIGEAISIASRYYKVQREEVQRGLASRSGASQRGKKRPRKTIPVTCAQCEQPPTWRITNSHGMARKTIYYACDKHKHDAADGFDDCDITGTEYKPVKTATTAG